VSVATTSLATRVTPYNKTGFFDYGAHAFDNFAFHTTVRPPFTDVSPSFPKPEICPLSRRFPADRNAVDDS
jgi:hypothetical protein